MKKKQLTFRLEFILSLSKYSRQALTLILTLFLTLFLFNCGCNALPKPQPRFISTNNNYSEEGLSEKVKKLEEVKKFSSTYTTKESQGLRDKMENQLLGQLEKEKEKPDEIRDIFSSIHPSPTWPKALPSYIEKAKFENKDCWIIVENWGTSEDEKLIRIRIWVFEQNTLQVLFAQSLILK